MADDTERKGGSRFAKIEAFQDSIPFGRVLDAGTGPKSLRWLKAIETDGWTAVTGDRFMIRQVERDVGKDHRPQDRLLLGNWNDPDLLAGERFDTVLADHLLGAIDGFAPYFQSALFPRLRTMTGKRLYVTGMEPYVIDRPADEAGRLIWQIGRYRDACLLLLGKQPFREYPLAWVLAELERSGFRVVATDSITSGYHALFVNGQIALVRPGLDKMQDRALAEALIARGETLRARALAYLDRHQVIRHGSSYVIAAEPA